MAGCLDLRFQKRWTEPAPRASHEEHRQTLLRKNLRSGIFWSTYSIEIILAVVLGQPLSLRDEVIDVQFPDDDGFVSVVSPANATNQTPRDSG